MAFTLEFIGTATTLLRLGPHVLLTDPDFRRRGHYAYLGKGLFSRRRTDPARQPADLPDLDGVLLSHLHGDHFDPVARRELDRDLPILTTSAASRKLERWGFDDARGMETWERIELADGLAVTSVPGQHAPGPTRRLFPPVMGTVVEATREDGSVFRLYITGDTLNRMWLQDVTMRLGPLDAMVIHLGGTRALGLLVTMDGDQGADLVDRLAPAVTVPVHYDDYTVFRSPLEEFLSVCRSRGVVSRIRRVGCGETIPLT